MVETKGNKADILAFIMQHEIITPHDLVGCFNYTLSYARKRLTLLKKQGLVEDSGNTPSSQRGQWALTGKGYSRVLFYHEKGNCSRKLCCYCGVGQRLTDNDSRLRILREKEEETAKERQAFYDQGYRDAMRRYKASYSCCICGKQVDVDTEGERKAVRQRMEVEKWGHAECLGGRKGLKISLTSVSQRANRLAAEISSLLAFYPRSAEYGIKPEQLDSKDLNLRVKEMKRLFPLLPLNEQEKVLKKTYPQLYEA